MHFHWDYLLIGGWLTLTVLAAIIFHLSTRDTRPAPKPDSAESSSDRPAKFIPKKEVWSQPSYDYHRTASPDGAVTPIEPDDGDFPPDDPPPDS